MQQPWMVPDDGAVAEPVSDGLHVMQVASGDLWGGAEAQVLELSIALRDSCGVRVSAALLNPGRLADSLSAAGISTLILDETRTSSPAILVRLTGLVRKLRPDVVHTHRRKENVLGGIAARLVGTPSVRTVHGSLEVREPLLRVDKQAYRLLDRLVAEVWQAAEIIVSPDLVNRIGARRHPEKLRVIRNGISPDRVRLAALSDPILPDTGSRIRLAFLGRLVQVKRADRILETVRMLLGDCPDKYSLFVIGDGPERNTLLQLAGRLNLSSNVHFLGERRDAIACLARMDALLMASEHEGLPMAALEALCLGVAPIVPPVGGLPELIGEALIGRVAASAAPEDLAAAVRDWETGRDQPPAASCLPTRWRIDHTALRYQQVYEAVHRGGLPPPEFDLGRPAR